MKHLFRLAISALVTLSLVSLPMVCTAGSVSVTGTGTAPKTGDHLKVPAQTPSITPTPYPNSGNVADQNSDGNTEIIIGGTSTTGDTNNKGTGNESSESEKKSQSESTGQ